MQHSYPLRQLLLVLLLALPTAALAQTTPGVGIGTTAPNASAALDIVSSSKGLLLPRLTEAARLAMGTGTIPAPAPGLLLYQTDGKPGFWYNSGTSAAPAWLRLTDSNGLSYDPSTGLQVGPTTPTTTTLSTYNIYSENESPFNGSNTSRRVASYIPAAVLQAAGVNPNLLLTALGFTVASKTSTGPFTNFTLRLANATSNPTATTTDGGIVLNTVYTGTVTTVAGLNTIPLTVPFKWDGTSGIYLETCFVTAAPVGIDGIQSTLQSATSVHWASGSSVCGANYTLTTTSAPVLTLTQGRAYTLPAGAGTPGQVLTQQAGGVVAFQDPQWTQSGTNLYPASLTSNVGIGLSAATARLDVNGGILVRANGLISTQGAHLQWNRSGSQGETWLLNQKGGGTADAGIRFGKSDQSNAVTEFGRFIDNGNLGLGDFTNGGSAPLTRLSISPNATEAKITLYDAGSSSDHYGLGVSGNQLNYHVLTTGDRHVFYAQGKNGNGTELLRIQGDGNVGIGTTTASGAPTQKLDVNGNVRVRTLGAGVVSADANGTLSSTSIATFNSSFVQNTTTPQAGANFNIGGSGTAGGPLTGAALQATTSAPIGTQGAHLQWNRSGGGGETWLLNQKGQGGAAAGIRFGKSDLSNATTEWARFIDNGNFGVGDFSGGSTPAPSATLDVNGGLRVRTLGPGVVSASANGTLSSSDGSGSFVLNQSATDQTATFRISGNGLVGGNLGVGTAAPSNRLDLGTSFGTSATDAATKKLAVYNSAAGTDFYGLGVSGGYLHLFAGAASTAAPALSISNTGNVGVGTSSPRGRLDVAGSGDSYLVADPSNGGSQNLYLPGALWLAPFNGTSGTAYVQARVPSPGTGTNLGLTLRTTNAGALLDALQLKADGGVTLPILSGSGTRVVTANSSGALGSATAASLDATTASNGLKELGSDIRLGGDLSQATVINQVGNPFSLDGGGQGQSAASISNASTNSGAYANGTLADFGQSFTLPVAATVTSISIDNSGVPNSGGSTTLRIYAGNGSTPTYTQTVPLSRGYLTFTLTTPQALPAGVSRFEFARGSGTNGVAIVSTYGTYGGGETYSDGSPQYGYDLVFALSYRTTVGVPTLYATATGRVGIGTSSPLHPLVVRADNSATQLLLGFSDNTDVDQYNFSLSGGGLNLSESNVASGRLFVQASTGNVGIGTTAPAYKLDVNGTIRGANVSPSDRRLKQDIRPLGPTLAQLLQLHGARYRWNALGVARGGEASREQIGLIAQEVEALYPELVSTDTEGYKAVNYAQLAPVLLEAIRELKAENEALKTSTAADHADLQTLKEQLARLLGEAPGRAQARR